MSNLFKSKKTETSKTEIDPQVYNRVLSNLQFAEQVAAIPYEPYRGLMVAPFTRDYMAGEAATRRIAQEGGFVPEVEAAARSAMGLMGYQPERVSAGQVGTEFGAAPISAERIGGALAGGPRMIEAGRVGAQFAPERIGSRDIGASLARGPERIAAGRIGAQFSPERIAAERVGASLAGGPERISAGRVGTTFGPERVGAGRVGTTFAAREIAAPGAAPTVQGASFLGQDLGRYMNPYEQAVIEAGLGDIDRAERARQAEVGRRATAARAFGGSRQAIEAGIAAGESARERNRFIAEQRAQAFREAAALRQADVGREQEAALANQAAAQNVMELAQRGQITNQQRDIELGRLGLTAEQANVDAQMRAALANQQAMQEAQRLGLTAEQANVQAGLEAARANQQAVQQYMQAGLSAEEANQRAMLDAAARNQAAVQEAQRLGVTAETTNLQAALEAARANQQATQDYMRMGLSAEEANQRAQMDAAARNQAAMQEAQRMGLTAETTNVQAGLEAARANQQAVQQYMQMGLSAEEANQRAMMEAASRNQQAMLEAQRMGSTAQQFNVQAMMDAAQRNQAAGLQGAQFQLGAGRQLADLGQQAMQNRYGAASALMGLGSAQQNLYQQFLNAQREEDFRRQQFPLQQLAIRQGAVQASPYNVTQTGTVTGRPSYWNIAGQVGSVAAPFFSDEKMKKNIKPIRNPLDKVRQLEGVEFEWKDDDSEDSSVIAQDVKKVMPNAVERDDDNGMLKVSGPQLIGLLTEAVKELDMKVDKMSKKRAKA